MTKKKSSNKKKEGNSASTSPTFEADPLQVSVQPNVSTSNRFASISEDITCMDTGLNSLSLSDMAQAQLAHPGRTLSQQHKVDLNEPDEVYPIDKLKNPLVNFSIFRNSGALIRIYNRNIPDEELPGELGSMRISTSRAENIPAYLCKEKGKIKSWAVHQTMSYFKEQRYNIGADPRLTIDEWTCKYTVASLSEYGRAILGSNEAGLWVLYCPELYEEIVARRYEDGSEDRFLLLNVYVNLVNPDQRPRVPEGGWSPKPLPPPTPEAQRRPYPSYQSYQAYPNRNNRPGDKRPRQDDNEIAKLAFNTLASIAQSNPTIQNAAAHTMAAVQYPPLPPTQNSRGVPQWPEGEVPNLSKGL